MVFIIYSQKQIDFNISLYLNTLVFCLFDDCLERWCWCSWYFAAVLTTKAKRAHALAKMTCSTNNGWRGGVVVEWSRTSVHAWEWCWSHSHVVKRVDRRSENKDPNYMYDIYDEHHRDGDPRWFDMVKMEKRSTWWEQGVGGGVGNFLTVWCRCFFVITQLDVGLESMIRV